MFEKGGIIISIALVFSLFGIGFVSAQSFSISEVSEGLTIVSISGADDLYAYEINIDYTGSIPSVTQANFLGSTSVATYGTSSTSSVLTIYGSRLDSSKTGIDGSGQAFNLSYSGSVSRNSAIFIDSSGNEEEVTYNTDSGSSSSSSSSGGGGGGGISVPVGVSLSVEPQDIEFNIFSGNIERGQIIITNTGIDIDLVIDVTGDLRGLLDFSETSFSLVANEIKRVDYVLNPVSRGLLSGSIVFKVSGATVAQIPVSINAKSENFLFDVGVSVLNRKISSSGILRAQIDLLEVVSGEQLDVTANYIIKDFDGNVYLEDSETFAVQEAKQFVKEFDIKKIGLLPGKYLLGLEIIYPGAFATSSSQFEVTEANPIFDRAFPLAILVVIMLIVGIVAVSWAQKSKAKFQRKRK